MQGAEDRNWAQGANTIPELLDLDLDLISCDFQVLRSVYNNAPNVTIANLLGYYKV